jgi:hypothetical protein
MTISWQASPLPGAIRDAVWLTSTRLVAYARMLVVAYCLATGLWIGLADGLRDREGKPLGTDFIDVYAAGVMVHQGRPQAAYDWPAHHRVEQEVAGFDTPYFGWHYPPVFLTVAWIVALVPYGWALAGYVAVGLAVYWTTIRRIAPPAAAAGWAVAAFPGLFVNAEHGQNACLTTALLGVAMMTLDRRPLLAGVAAGLLVYKPQFFLAIPLILAAGGYWRAVFSSLGTAVLCALASLWLFGWATWQAFLGSTLLTRTVILEQGATGWAKIQSVFSLVRLWGGGIGLAYTAQIGIGVGAVAVAAWLWHRRPALATRTAALCAALMLSTPYQLDYDLMILAVPIAALSGQALAEGFLPYEKTLLAALWLLPLIARPAGMAWIPLTPPLLVGLLALAVRRTRSPRIL